MLYLSKPKGTSTKKASSQVIRECPETIAKVVNMGYLRWHFSEA